MIWAWVGTAALGAAIITSELILWQMVKQLDRRLENLLLRELNTPLVCATNPVAHRSHIGRT